MLNNGRPMPPRPVPEPLATLEGYTYSALNTGMVELPGRTVQAAMWFRILRSLLDEVSLAITSRRKQPAAALRTIWKAAGLPPRGGLGVWAPYEMMEPEQQHVMMTAAATATDLAARHEILVLGRLGPAIQPLPLMDVYAGDRPPPARNAWQELVTEIELMLDDARTDPTVAGEALQLLTRTCKTLRQFEVRRGYLLRSRRPRSFPSLRRPSRPR
ncbi:hypothetical protein [Tenggerimyces flavus]|uniref:Uncharacterized protein n=1 Tax=Tenggerimyces flavus TaxID=1708749 RepID=A0ABV7Y3J0_9ACTN|nr:hypothetical protein [Tenggerimyces flavus]MBM7790340.1 hypothetical protein [Tenggerimyces flavus]